MADKDGPGNVKSEEDQLANKITKAKIAGEAPEKPKTIVKNLVENGTITTADDKKIDLKNWRSNQKNSGFLPEEREWLDGLFDDLGFVDGFREVNQEPEQYTWWSNRGRAWDNNVGWRIDYHVVTEGLADRILRTEIYKDERFSDHAPLIMDYDWNHGD